MRFCEILDLWPECLMHIRSCAAEAVAYLALCQLMIHVHVVNARLLQVFDVATDAGADDVLPAAGENDRLEGYKVNYSCRCLLILCICQVIAGTTSWNSITDFAAHKFGLVLLHERHFRVSHNVQLVGLAFMVLLTHAASGILFGVTQAWNNCLVGSVSLGTASTSAVFCRS